MTLEFLRLIIETTMLDQETLPIFSSFINFHFKLFVNTVYFDKSGSVARISTARFRKQILILSAIMEPTLLTFYVLIALKDILDPTVPIELKVIYTLAVLFIAFTVICYYMKSQLSDFVGLLNDFITLNNHFKGLIN